MWLNDLYHALDPIALTVGPLSIRWYGLAYLFGFIATGFVMYRVARHWHIDLTVDDVVTLMTGIACGVILGGRLGYVIFYGRGYYLQHPLSIIMLNEGGMSFHGGLIGAAVGAYLTNLSLGLSLGTIVDLMAIGAPIGLCLGRCGNFINGELWGRVADPALPWAMVFPGAMLSDGSNPPRHPSQLYQFALEGVLLFVLLWLYARRPRRTGQVAGAFLLGYGVLRFVVEFFREPDAHLGLLGLGMSMGQWLCLPMMAAGVALMVLGTKGKFDHAGH